MHIFVGASGRNRTGMAWKWKAIGTVPLPAFLQEA
jgi:hypothetical protein